MGRSAASIQTQITLMEAQLPNLIAAASATRGDTTVAQQRLGEFQGVLDALYQQLDRATGSAPMMARGYLEGLR